MINIGIDLVEIARFKDWHTFTHKSLLRIFSSQEIEYCLSVPIKSSERFAARFAAREAFLKALHQAIPEIKIPLLKICKAIQIINTSNGAPQIIVDWDALKLNRHIFNCSVSWTHTKTVATTIVVIEKKIQ